MPPGEEVHTRVEALFRTRSGAVTAALTRLFGPGRLDVVEAVRQEAFLRALALWPSHGVPDEPVAWLIKVSRNLALDRIRRDRRLAVKEGEVARWFTATVGSAAAAPEATFGHELADDQLRMMFVCCHPALARPSQVVLTLQTLCGMAVEEIARLLLTAADTVAKRLTRAKAKLRQAGVDFDLPPAAELSPRLEAVQTVLYLLFSEGHSAHKGKRPVRRELCREAIQLTTLLAAHPIGDTPATQALLALMHLHAARLDARLDADGNLLTLAEQDRRLWSRRDIELGLLCLARSATGGELSAYHLEAGIAACHARAGSYDDTDWTQIVSYYDRLAALNPSPVVALNRAIAIGMRDGPERGIAELKAIGDHPRLDAYHLLPAAFGDFYERSGNRRRARDYYRRAETLARTAAERRFLARRLERL